MFSEVDDVEKPLEHTQFFDNAYVPISREEEVTIVLRSRIDTQCL